MDNNIDINGNDYKRRLTYYENARKEIEREYGLTYQIITSNLTLQGFLITASALMIENHKYAFEEFSSSKLFVFLFIGLTGLALSIISLLGIQASRKSLRFAREEWVNFNQKNGDFYPKYVPQITRRSNETIAEAAKNRITDYITLYAIFIVMTIAVFLSTEIVAVLFFYYQRYLFSYPSYHLRRVACRRRSSCGASRALWIMSSHGLKWRASAMRLADTSIEIRFSTSRLMAASPSSP